MIVARLTNCFMLFSNFDIAHVENTLINRNWFLAAKIKS